MKGIINKGIQELVEEKYGTKAWEKVKSVANCEEPFFAISLDYPDEMTTALIKAASAVSGLSVETVMLEYGKFMVPNTLKKYYSTYFKIAGSSPREFLLNMGRVHEHVTKGITGAKPPQLKYEELPNGRMLIHYSSERRLCAVLHGLILGVGIFFNQQLDVHETVCMLKGDDRCTMEITFP